MELNNGVKAVTTLQLNPVTKVQKDYGYSQGFLEEWLKSAPPQVKQHLETLVKGIEHYRNKYLQTQEELAQRQRDYSNLAGLSASYLQQIQQQKEQLDEFLIEEQKPLHQRYIET